VRSVLKVTLAVAAAALAGCSSVRIAYENADAFVLWRANSYLELQGAAYEALDERIDDFFDWHRATALPQYAKLSEEAASRMAKGLSRADLVWGYDSFMGQARESLRAAAVRIGPLLDGLSARQLKRMEQRFDDDNRRYRKDNLRGSETERRKRRAKRTQERLEDWVGDLDRAQVQRVREYSERAPLFGELHERERMRIQGELLAMARERSAARLLGERAAAFDAGRDPAYVAAADNARGEFFQLLLDLDRSLSAQQRAHAVENLRRYARDFHALSRREPPSR
jgi:Family of unknown function (DUF6279)